MYCPLIGGNTRSLRTVLQEHVLTVLGERVFSRVGFGRVEYGRRVGRRIGRRILAYWVYTMRIQCVYNVYTMCIQCVHNAYTMCARLIYSVYAMYRQCVYNVYTMCIQCV